MIAAVLGVSALALLAGESFRPANAQLRPDSSAAQLGRAPLSFADIVERVRPAVVSISVSASGPRVSRNAQPQPGTPPQKKGTRPDLFPDLPEDHPFNELFKNLPKEFRGTPTPRPALAQGSGFVISADGFVVTNNHVVDGATKITVTFDESNKHEATLVGTDPRTDLAVLKIKSDRKFPFVKFSDKTPRVGDWVLAVGNPFGLGGTVTAGIVSALGRDIGSGPYDFLQIDAAVNRGNSGGPTFNLDGEVVGVNTAIFSPSGGNVGIAFAVPARTALDVIAQLKTSGSVSRGWLGVRIQNIDEDTAQSLGLAEAKGALVNEVTANGPAAAAGLKAQDAILQVNGDKINDSRDLARKIAEYAPNTNVDVRIVRDGKEQTIKVKLGQFPKQTEDVAKSEPSTPAPVAKAEIGALGLSLATGAAQKGLKEGVLIAEVEAGSDAATKGLKAGDVIVEINSQPVASPADVEGALKKAKDLGRKAVLLSVKSAEQKRLVAVQLKKG
jgi:serine protease Do